MTTPAAEWRDRAACLGSDPALFFPTRGEPTKQIKAVCAACSVRLECGDHALEENEKLGIWGGMSERERRRVRRGRRRDSAA